MIKVNWDKIKPFERKPFAIFAITALLVLLIGALVIGAINPLMYMPLKLLTAVFVFITVAFKVRIESRMLQIYMLLGVLDVSLFCAAIMPFPIGLTFFFFAVSLLSVILCVATTVWASVFVKKDTAYNFPEADRSSVFANKNVMFFAPHEDDEINIYGGVIEQYVKYGSDVRIVFYTNGDYHNLGQLRIKETLCVAKKYNIPEKNIIFLGYSDSLTDKNSLHIYNSKDGEEVFYSRYVVSQTYGIKPKPPYKEHKFTRNNILSDIKSVILEYKPDTLFCCDYDEHMDHRALSMFFEEALYSILKENTLYFSEVYKGFAYSTAWHGNEDYYSLNALSTRLIEPSAYMKETGYYDWKDRVRFPVAKEKISQLEYEKKMDENKKKDTRQIIEKECLKKASRISKLIGIVLKILFYLLFGIIIGYSTHITYIDTIVEKETISIAAIVLFLIAFVGLIDMSYSKMHFIIKILKRKQDNVKEYLYNKFLKKEKNKRKDLYN